MSALLSRCLIHSLGARRRLLTGAPRRLALASSLLAAQNALSRKDLDDATGNGRETEAAVIVAKGQVEAAQLNRGYTTIKPPLAGLLSYAKQHAVQQGAKSHFVWTLDKDNKPRQRGVEVGEWQGDNCFINDGLRAGERIVADGAVRISPTSTLSAAGTRPASESAAKGKPATAPQWSDSNSMRQTAAE